MPPSPVTLISEEANFIQVMLEQWSQIEGTVISDRERSMAKSIVKKVRNHIISHLSIPINFTEDETNMLQYLFTKYVQMHGKPAGDLDWTYFVHLIPRTRELIRGILNKIGENWPEGSLGTETKDDINNPGRG
jgi:hypothetical protein